VTATKDQPPRPQLYLGADVGGTKMMAAVVERAGTIRASKRVDTPRDGSPQDVLAGILQLMADTLGEAQLEPSDLTAVGLGVPGVVDPDEGRVVVTPNMPLAPLEIVPPIEERFGVPVALGNDVNLGTLGEKWLGAAQRAKSAVGIFVGTGIGGGVVLNGELVRGCREGAGEIGHMVMQVGGPRCGCGNRGCLEALASRSAIERDIRQALEEGRKSAVSELLDGEEPVIKSGVLRRALKANDPLVTEIMLRASEILGAACLTVRHLLDPEVIVLGGGLVEACGSFIMPIVRGIVSEDALPGARPGCYVARSELGDAAVVLGAVALARSLSGDTALEDALATAPDYPTITYAAFGEVSVGKSVYKTDVVIRGDGKVRKRDRKVPKRTYGTSHKIGPEELEKVCRGHPALLVIGTGQSGMVTLTAEGEEFLLQRGIAVQALPSPRAVKAYNRAKGRKAAIIHVKC